MPFRPWSGAEGSWALFPWEQETILPGNLGIGEDLDFACDLLLKGKVRKMDVIQVDSGPYMAGVGGVGFDSEVNAIANKLSRFLREKLPTSCRCF